jgi:FtsP/CotA-like multicopper oxidase with cupredoxin domain
MKNFKKFICLLIVTSQTFILSSKLVKYRFDISKIKVNFTGKKATALAINNQIPAPTIEATVGDTLQVTFDNKMDEETSIHWHGILLPNDQDGVPYLTTPPIKPKSSFTYRFKIKHPGTYWYHSHTNLQEQRGLYGALIFHPKMGEKIKTHRDYVVVLSDWTNEKPNNVLANLKKDGDYYALKKKSVQSWDRVIQNGFRAIKNRLHGAWTRMGPMDISDIGYDAFLSNGKQKATLHAKPGETLRLRIINSAAATYFNVEFAGGPMTIVSADGVDVEPVKVKRFRIAIAETYDVIIKIPDYKFYELRATAEDGTGHSSTFIGSGEKIFAPDIPRPNLFLMEHDAHDKHHKPEIIKYMKGYDALRSVTNTSLPKNRPYRHVKINLTGNMESFTWSFNNKTLLESNKIFIRKGENVRFLMNNKTMMHHPIHLHGHFFRVLNGQNERCPLKHTVDVPSMGKTEIEFQADEEKDWFFHCHNLYHMVAGMARSVAYEKTTVTTSKTFKKLAHDNFYFLTDLAGLYNMTFGMLRISNTRNAFEVEYDYNYNKEYDVDVVYVRNFTRFFDAYIGANLEREHDKTENTGILGIRYVLPLLIESDLRVDTSGKVRLGLKSDLQLTKRIKFEWSINTDEEYRLILSYEFNKNILATAAYDSDFKEGVGLRVRF